MNREQRRSEGKKIIQMPQTVQAKVSHPGISQKELEDLIENTEKGPSVYMVKLGKATMICCIRTKTGHEIVGYASVTKPEDFKEQPLANAAYQKAMGKLVDMEIYRRRSDDGGWQA